jgi:hypothetical protein
MGVFEDVSGRVAAPCLHGSEIPGPDGRTMRVGNYPRTSRGQISWGMPPDYSSMWAKLGRAEELLNHLDNEVGTWLKFKPYEGIPTHNKEMTHYAVTLRVHREPDMVRWSLQFADLIHNLRCALDHLLWAIIVHESLPNDPVGADHLQFPIWKSPPNSNTRRNIACLSQRVRAAIEFVQPYNAVFAHGLPVHPLILINELDNRNKHRLLYLAMAGAASGRIRFNYMGKFQNDPEVSLEGGEIKDGTELVSATFKIPQPDVTYEFNFSLIIAILYGAKTVCGGDRDDYSALADLLIREVLNVIGVVVSAAQ